MQEGVRIREIFLDEADVKFNPIEQSKDNFLIISM